MLNQTYQQISSEIYKLSSKVKQTPYTLVQSPREIPTELKKEIRDNLRKDNEDIYPIFQINKNVGSFLKPLEKKLGDKIYTIPNQSKINYETKLKSRLFIPM